MASLFASSCSAASFALIASDSSRLSALSAVSDKTVTKSGCISKNPPEQKKASSSDPFCTLTGPGARPVKSGVCPGAMPSSPSVPVA